jgi:hypothetical protein
LITEGSGSILWIVDPDPDPGCPQTCGSGGSGCRFGPGSGTLFLTLIIINFLADEMAVMLDQAQILHASMEKKSKQFDRIVTEWKAKVDSLSMDLDNSQKETRNSSSELFRIKNAYEESVLQLEEVIKF